MVDSQFDYKITKCYGNGKCIKMRNGRYYRPFKCQFNCKLVPCNKCGNNSMPSWLLNKNNGICNKCHAFYHNQMIMQRVFQK